MSRAWDKEKILSPYEESNLRSSDSALWCSTTSDLDQFSLDVRRSFAQPIKRHLWQSGSTQTFQSKGLVPGGIDCEPRPHCLYAFLPNKTMQWVRGKMSKEKKNSPLCLLLTCAAFSSLKLTAIFIIVTGVMKYFRRCWSFAFNHYLFTTRVQIVVDYIFCLYFNLLSSWWIFFLRFEEFTATFKEK